MMAMKQSVFRLKNSCRSMNIFSSSSNHHRNSTGFLFSTTSPSARSSNNINSCGSMFLSYSTNSTTTTTTSSNHHHHVSSPTTPPKLIVLVGPPASGKGTHSRLLAQRYPNIMKIVSAEDTLREAAKNNDELNGLLKKGDLAPRELTDQLLQQNIRQLDGGDDSGNNKKVIILEGYPRDVEQAKQFLAWFSDKKLSVRKSHVFILHLLSDKENIMKRLQGRLIHASSGRPYHVEFNPPMNDMTDDVTGEALMRREDDQDKNAILKRLALYREETLPMIDFLTEHEFDVIDIAQGDQGISEVSDRIEEILKEKDVIPKDEDKQTDSESDN